MSEPTDLKAPILLLAMPQVMDPFFHKSVVLLLHHQQEGSLGFIVNRPTGVQISDLLEELDVSWLAKDGSMAFFGGPVQPQQGTLIYLEEQADESTNEICPGVALTQHLGDLEGLGESPPATYRFLLGYAGWGEDQLVNEILRNDWILAPVRTDLLFSDDPDETWAAALASVGISPDQLPTWTPGSDDAAN